MCIATTKKAAGQLQKILNKLGKFGGIIETDNPGTWWNLDVEIESISDDEKNIMIGVYKEFNGDIMFDPLFHVTAKFDEDKISEVCVNQCTEDTALGHTIVDCDNMLHGFGQVTKDPYGLKKRFCNFMDNMMIGPYLSTGRILRKYDAVLDE